MRLLVTGGAGFIGSNFIHFILKEHQLWQVTNIDKLTYAGNLENLEDIKDNARYIFVKGDITNKELIDNLLSRGFDAIINFAAESHVDRSILDSSPFIDTNVKGTQVLLEGVRKHKVERFLQISTDEVYGSREVEKFTEESPLLPNSPYAASKASSDLLCRAYYSTYKLPIITTRCSNNYGPYQFPEKLIPLVITNALENRDIPVYGDGLNVRDWIYVEDHCRALDLVLQKGKPGEIYNVGANNEKTNLELIELILNIMDKPKNLMKFVSDRPGHDRRYAIDMTKIETEFGWKPITSFEDGISNTIKWYINNESWWQRIKSGDCVDYYQKVYSIR
ncbi:MAG: dTDP-glucose 4,6-dehydratase [candidate division WS2 bacterium]|uniref:dTDP-glucose 4,6-dehydratase n=1 Tax=Psychracetigena formicireducens TaxID=2986056 RepID=A0A9E2BHA5_PSYF1|nr:dTDP-glucose 4,6-dehydratase [Candidatus Psychracetigena formicireducens]